MQRLSIPTYKASVGAFVPSCLVVAQHKGAAAKLINTPLSSFLANKMASHEENG